MGEERDSRESARESRNGEVEGASSERNGWGTREGTWCPAHVYVLYVLFGLLGWVSFPPFL